MTIRRPRYSKEEAAQRGTEFYERGIRSQMERDVHPTSAHPTSAHPRQGWEERFKVMAARGDDRLIDPGLVSGSHWDEDEWEW